VTVLITGGCGFVGINLAEALLEAGETVVLLDRIALPPSASDDLSRYGARLSVVISDVTDAKAVHVAMADHAVRRVVHAAVVTADAAREMREPSQIVEVNVGGTINVLGAARATDCERIVYVGSGQAYGATHEAGQRLDEEASPSRPTDLYGITKYCAERIALRMGVLWQLDVVCVRLGSVCGPWEFATGVRDMLSPYLRTAQFAVAGETAIIPSKEYWRDWVYSRDVAGGLHALLRVPRPPGKIYHLSSGVNWHGSFDQWCDLLRAAYPRFSWRTAAVGEVPNVSFVVERDRSPMNVARIGSDAGFVPRFGPRDAYADYINWIRAHEDFIRDSR
jgi:UDP-glucuronate 4-epimerase